MALLARRLLLNGVRQTCLRTRFPPRTLQPALVLPPRFFSHAAAQVAIPEELITNSTATTSLSPEEKPSENSLSLADYNLHTEVRKGLEKMGIQSFFPAQAQSFESIMAGNDFMCRSRTGSGKTLAFVLPIVEKLLRNPTGGRTPRAVILAPTRELAKQVGDEIGRLNTKLRYACIYGGAAVGPQVSDLKRGVDIVVGTPGRVIDLLNQSVLKLGKVEFAVLDEADEMLRMGFQEDVEQIFEYMPEQRQTLLFSATIPGWVHKCSKKYLNDPVFLDLVEDKGRIPTTVRHLAIRVTHSHRIEALVAAMSVYGAGKRCLVFTSTKREADLLANSSAMEGVNARALHGDLSQGMREQVLNSFRAGQVKVLVATDVAARGLDIPEVELVIHYRLPQESEAFVHRTGRTGRAGRNGVNILLYEPKESFIVKQWEEELMFNSEKRGVPGPEEFLSAAIESLKSKMENVSPGVVKSLEGHAMDLLKDGDKAKEILATAMAVLMGMRHKQPTSFSLLDGQPEYQTLRLDNCAAHNLKGFEEEVLESMSTKMRKSMRNVALMKRPQDRKTVGFLFDVPAGKTEEFLEWADAPGTISLAHEIPNECFGNLKIISDIFDNGGSGGRERGRGGFSSNRSYDKDGGRYGRSNDREGKFGRSSYDGRGRGGGGGRSYGERGGERGGGRYQRDSSPRYSNAARDDIWEDRGRDRSSYSRRGETRPTTLTASTERKSYSFAAASK